MSPARPRQRFQISEALPRIAALTGRELDRDTFVREVLEEILRMRFDRARFWERAYDAGRATDIVVLTDKTPPGSSGKEPGYWRDWADSDVAKHAHELASSDDKLFPVVTARNHGDKLAQLEKDLDLKGRVRVEIPVTAGPRVVSILACDWQGSEDELTPADRHALRIVGSLIGSHRALESTSTLASDDGRRSDDPHLSAGELVNLAAQDLGRALDAAITAVFTFSWTHQEVEKTAQFVSEAFETRAKRRGRLREKYPVVARTPDEISPLTGAAWRNRDLRHIVLFETLRAKDTTYIDPESFEWHTDVLDEIRSILYAVVGTTEKKYLLRFMNRATRPELPFLGETAVLKSTVGDLRVEIDAAVGRDRVSSLQRVGALATTSMPSDLLNEMAAVLGGEGIDQVGVICHQRDSAQIGFSQFVGDRCNDLVYPRDARWKDDALYAAALDGQLQVLPLSEYAGSDRSALATLLASRNFRSVLAQPMQVGHTRGALFVAMDVTPPRQSGRDRALPEDIGYGTPSLLDAYARLLAASVESGYSQERVKGARRAYGLMGHELRRPATALGSAGLKAIVVSREALESVQDEAARSAALGVVATSQMELRAAQHRVDALLRLARLVSRESEGRLRLRFAPTDLSRLLTSAVAEVSAELREDPGEWTYHFVLNDAARSKLGRVVVDGDYLSQALKNVLMNAAKYSLPRRTPDRGGRRSVDIEVIGEPQPQARWVGIKVRNWGWELPADKRDAVFEPWVRGRVEEDFHAIPGMGLGLFLTRRLLLAHDDGEILVSSLPTADHYFPKPLAEDSPIPGLRTRRESIPIFETTFEMRISKTIRAGVRTHDWQAQTRSATDEG